MPNWCSNKLKIRCSPERFEEILAKFVIRENSELILDLNAIDPEPEELSKYPAPAPDVVAAAHRRKYGAADWYEWRIQHWGTKWLPTVHTITDQTLFFDSAWAPPLPAIEKLAAMYKDVRFGVTYSEPDNCLHGRITFNKNAARPRKEKR